MELGGIPEKIDEYFHWGPISMYVLQGIGSPSCIIIKYVKAILSL